MSYQVVLIVLIALLLLSWLLLFVLSRKLNLSNKYLAEKNSTLLNDMADARLTIDNLIEEAGRMVVITDLEGRIIVWNKNAASTFGYSKESIINKNIKILDLEKDVWDFQSIVEEVPVSGELRFLEFQKKTSSGKVIDLIATATSLKDRSGKPYQVNFSMEDFSERNQLVQLRVNREKLLAAIGSLNKLLATLSHHINNSITSISGMAQLAELDQKFNTKFINVTKVQVDRIQAVLKSLSKLVDSLNLKTRDYVGEKDGLFDIENEISAFLETIEKKSSNII